MGIPGRLGTAVVTNVVFVGAIAACGITAVGTLESAPPGADASGVDVVTSSPDSASEDDGASPSVDSSAPDVASCTVVIDDAFATLSSSWQLYGDAVHFPGRVDLVPAQAGQWGAVFWNAPISFGSMLYAEVEYAFETPDAATLGEGFMVAWLDTSTPYVQGTTGAGLGLCGFGLNGTAIMLDSRDSQLGALSGISGNCGTNGGIKSANVSAASKVTVEIRADRIDGALSTGTTISRTRTNPTTGLFGFTASTGATGILARHSITRLKVTACP